MWVPPPRPSAAPGQRGAAAGPTFQTVLPSSLPESSENGHRLPRPPADPQNPPGPQVGGWTVTLQPDLSMLLCRASPCAPWPQVWGICSPENPWGKGLPLAPPQGGARAPLTHRGEARLGASSGPENSSPSGIAGPCHQSGSLGSSGPGTGMLGRDPGLWSWFPAAGQSLSLSPVPNLGCPYTLWPAVSPNVLRDTSWGRRPVCGWPQWPSTGFFPPCGWSWKPAGRNDLPWEAGH